MKTRHWKLVMILSVFWSFCLSQNIVPNPNFENFNSCPTGPCQWQRCISWNNVNMIPNCPPKFGPLHGTPDYYRVCGTGGSAPPNTFQGTCAPLNGNAMMGVVLYNASFANSGREYISCELTCSMVPGNTYSLSFWLSNGTGPISPWTINNIGVHFSPTALTQTGMSLVNLVPTCEITTNVASNGWTQFTFLVNPTVPCKFMTIGSFRPDNQLNPTLSFNTPTNIPAYNYSYYFIDSVEVFKPASLNLSLSSTVTQMSCNNSIASATVSPSTTAFPVSYLWSPGNYTTSSVSGLSPGVYTVVATSTNPCYTASASTVFTIHPAPVPVPISVQNYSFCSNATLTIPISASSTFPPGSVVFNWSGPNILPPTTGSTVVVGPNVTSIYTITATSTLGCPNSATLAVTVTTNCCSGATTALTPITSNLTGGTLASGAYLLLNSITVSGANVLSNLEIQMMPGVKITVLPNASFVLGNSHLYACGTKMWDGVELQDGSFFTNNGFNLIEDAEVAFDIPNTSLATIQNTSQLPSFNNMVFNRNYIGIRIRNADASITTYPLAVEACVFTSRHLPFTGWPGLTWPTSSTSDLRAVMNPTTGLAPPYNLQGYGLANLKWPHTTIPGYVGIQIVDVGNTAGSAPNPGVVIGSTNAVGINDPTIFALFDNLGKGIDVTDASLTTMNNVFQNLRNFQEGGNWTLGSGVYHRVTSSMNAVLDLGLFNGANQTTSLGNRFWNCWDAVNAKNVFRVNIHHGIFRSTQNVNLGYAPGAVGVILESNRFNYSINDNEFNNISHCIWLNVTGGAYDIGGSANNGTYADDIDIQHNYFGPEVASTVPLNPGTEYANKAITLVPVGPFNWNINGRCEIFSNKLDRVYNGIKVEGSQNYPIEIGGNEIYVIDDNFVAPAADQYGIYGLENQGELIVNHNTVSGQGVSNNRVKLIRLADNVSNGIGQYPEVVKNEVSNAYKGFAFEGFQPDTRWECNTLYTPLNYGFCLEQSSAVAGVVGPQGGPCMESGNEYLPTMSWVAPNFYTYSDNLSNPVQSPLYVALFQTTPPPAHATGGGSAYTNTPPSPSGTFYSNFSPGCVPSPVNDCPIPSPYAPVPSQRTAAITGFDQKRLSPDEVAIYPNPTSGNITISGYNEAQNLGCKIWDVSGKLVLEKEIFTSGSNVNMNLDLQKGIYLLEIKMDNASTTHKKLIIE